jgi:hypothetical protein
VPGAPATGAATPDQINEWKQAYENRQEWQRANTQKAQALAREREELAAIKEWADALQTGYQTDPRVREFVDGFNKLRDGGGQEPVGGVPGLEGQQPGKVDPAIAQELLNVKQRLEQFERARDAEWADKVYSDAQAEFQKITGRNWTPQEHARLAQDLQRTGSIDPKAQMFWTFRNEFAQSGNKQAQANVAAAQAAASGAHVEGIAGGDQSQPLDLRTADPEITRKLALRAIGGNPDDDTHPWIYTTPSK